MSTTTYLAYLQYLADLSVTGVTTNRGSSAMGAPDSVQSADLPLMFVDLPIGDESPITFNGQGGWPTLGAEVVIVVESMNLNLDSARFDSLVTMFDNLATALRAADITNSKLAWNTALEVRGFGNDGAEYLCVVAFVQGVG